MIPAMDFAFDGHFWTARLRLESWEGFQARGGPYGSLSSAQPSEGEVDLVFAPEGRRKIELQPPSADETALVQWFLDREPAVSAAVLAAVSDAYPCLRAEWATALEATELAECMPEITGSEELKTLIGLHAVYVHIIDKDAIPYIGFEFGCTWDGEHGLGVLMHGTRLVRIGGADVAMTLWMAQRDVEGVSQL